MEKKQDDLKSDIRTTPTGRQVYDVGESVVTKMNREKAVFDKDLFFQDLYENYLVCVMRGEVRQKPKSGLVLYWTQSNSFEDFLSDGIEGIDRQIESIKFAKAVGAHKVTATEGDFFMSEAKIDAGSSAAGKAFSVEDYDAIYEILRKSKETIQEYFAGKLNLIINTKTGRVRMTQGAGN